MNFSYMLIICFKCKFPGTNFTISQINLIASNFVWTLVGLLLLSFATTFVLSDLELKCKPISEHIFRAWTLSILTSSVLHAKARPYEATMSTRSVKHERYLIIFGPKVAIRTSAVAFAVSNLILCRSLAGAEAGAWVDSTNWPLRIGWPRPMGLEQG